MVLITPRAPSARAQREKRSAGSDVTLKPEQAAREEEQTRQGRFSRVLLHHRGRRGRDEGPGPGLLNWVGGLQAGT